MNPSVTNCPLECGGILHHDPTPLRDNRFGLPIDVTISWCDRCGLGITCGGPDQRTLDALYSSEYDSDVEYEDSGIPRTDLLGRLWHRINGSLPLSDLAYREPVLDIGSNRGDLLVALRNRGIRGLGLEPNPVAAAFARSRGLEIVEAPIEDAQLPASEFGSIVVSQVLEHVSNPIAVLRRLRAAASDDARLYIVVPNAGSVWRKVFGPDWVHWHVPFHLYHHTTKSLNLLLELAGFEVLAVRTVTPGEWLLMSLEARRNARRGVYHLEHFSGRFLARLALAPLARTADWLKRGDAIFALARPNR